MRARLGMVLVVGIALGTTFLLSSSGMAKDKEMVAVVELANTSKRVSDDEAQFITDSIRSGASNALDRARFMVMTRESMDVLLGPSKIVCLAGKCLAEIGRTLQAKYVLGGSLKDVGGRIGFTLEVYESATAALMASDVGRAKDIDETILMVQALAPRLIAKSTGAAAAAGEPPRSELVLPAPIATTPDKTGNVDKVLGGSPLFNLLAADFRQVPFGGAAAALETGYRELCSAGLTKACQWRDWHRSDGPNLVALGQAFRPLCDKGDPMACTAVGWSLTRKPGRLRYLNAAAPEAVHGAALFRKACNNGFLYACGDLGELFVEGVGVPKDPVAATLLFRKACDGGEATGCHAIGHMYANGIGVERDDARAVGFFRQSCDGGDINGCSELGFMYSKGTGIGKDDARAVELSRKGCDGGVPQACANLGYMYANG